MYIKDTELLSSQDQDKYIVTLDYFLQSTSYYDFSRRSNYSKLNVRENIKNTTTFWPDYR